MSLHTSKVCIVLFQLELDGFRPLLGLFGAFNRLVASKLFMHECTAKKDIGKK